MTRYLILVLSVVYVFVSAGMAKPPTVWNYVADFDSSGGTKAVNPNGAWEYGHNWAPNVGGPSPTENLPGYNTGYVAWPTNTLHPYFNVPSGTGSLDYLGKYAADPNRGISVRWTAPAAGRYSVAAWAVSTINKGDGTTFQVHQVNAAMTTSTQLWSAAILPLPATTKKMPAAEVHLGAGDKIIFFIPISASGWPYAQFDATITKVFNPATNPATIGSLGCWPLPGDHTSVLAK